MNKRMEAFIKSIEECGGTQSYAAALAVGMAQCELEARILKIKSDFSIELQKVDCEELQQIIQEGDTL